ncbi:MAG: hypothetical protein GXO23_03115 [Crenarchaeota archaeon]|nr:hypothetical protein [Thermoproteota archaeon]
MSEGRINVTPLVKIYLNLIEKIVGFEYDNADLGKLAVKTAITLLKKGEGMSEDKIASALNVETSEIRKVLQVLFKHGLIDSEKEVIDPDRGRYETRWFLSDESISRILRNRVKRILEVLKSILDVARSEAYYYCPTCYRRYSVDEAYDYDFKCPRDETPLAQSDQTQEVECLIEVIRLLQDFSKEFEKR